MLENMTFIEKNPHAIREKIRRDGEKRKILIGVYVSQLIRFILLGEVRLN